MHDVALKLAVVAAGGILADWGAEVVKIEPPGGDKTRRLNGSGGEVSEESLDDWVQYTYSGGPLRVPVLTRGDDVLLEGRFTDIAVAAAICR